jgi:hypothetical protein
LARAVIERKDIPQVGFCLHELWEIDDDDKKVEMRCLSPVPLVEGKRRPRDVETAKRFLHADARDRNLVIIREAE